MFHQLGMAHDDIVVVDSDLLAQLHEANAKLTRQGEIVASPMELVSYPVALSNGKPCWLHSKHHLS